MDLLEERVLAVLNDGNSRFFTQLLNEVGFSRNTLKLRLKHLVAQSLVVKEKTVSNGRGSPKSPIRYRPEPDGKSLPPSQTRP
jgi:DNA-binding HxlR family transcriptional regulator